MIMNNEEQDENVRALSEAADAAIAAVVLEAAGSHSMVSLAQREEVDG